MTELANANLKQIPVGSNAETFNLSLLPEPAKVLKFPEQVDQFLGCCDGCGLHVYSSDPHRLEPSLTCSTCLAEESAWKVAPAVYEVAA
jgi:hypothetical protein